jgi:hypothetical protein
LGIFLNFFFLKSRSTCIIYFIFQFHSSFHTLPRESHHLTSSSLQPLSVTTFLVPSTGGGGSTQREQQQDPALSDPGGVATLGRRKRLSSSRLTENSDHIYALVQPKDQRFSTASSASMASAPPNLLDLIPPPPSYPPPSPRPTGGGSNQREQPRPTSPLLLNNRRNESFLAAASEATEETSRLLMTDECDGSWRQDNGYAKLKGSKNRVRNYFGFSSSH